MYIPMDGRSDGAWTRTGDAGCAPPIAPPAGSRFAGPVGCICPPRSEETCKAPYCHRRGGSAPPAAGDTLRKYEDSPMAKVNDMEGFRA